MVRLFLLVTLTAAVGCGPGEVEEKANKRAGESGVKNVAECNDPLSCVDEITEDSAQSSASSQTDSSTTTSTSASSTSSSSTSTSTTTTPVTPELSSWSFLAANNPSLLTDVTGTVSSSGTVTISLPYLATLSHLIPTFTVNSGTTITYNSAALTSGSSTISFSSGSASVTLTSSTGQTKDYTISTTAQSFAFAAYLKAPNANTLFELGRNLILKNGMLLAGSHWDNSTTTSIINGSDLSSLNTSGTQTGAAAVFGKGSSGWELKAYLKPPYQHNSLYFGLGGADFDGTTAAIGSSRDDGNTTSIIHNASDLSSVTFNLNYSGSVVTFSYNSSTETWAFESYIKPPKISATDYFGTKPTLNGNYMAVGAHGEDSNTSAVIQNGDYSSINDTGTDVGAVWIFKKVSGQWQTHSYIKPPNAHDGMKFGNRIAFVGDTLIVGSCSEKSSTTGIIHSSDLSSTNTSGTNNGAVYVYKLVNDSWQFEAYIKPPIMHAGAQFCRVSYDGTTLAVGSHLEKSDTTSIINGSDLSSTNSNRTTGAGAVYLYSRQNSTWSLDAYIKASQMSDGDTFGKQIIVEKGLLAVTSAGEDSDTTSILYGTDLSSTNDSGSNIGAVYLFSKASGSWVQSAYIKPPHANSMNWGYIALDGGILAVGANYEKSTTTQIINGTDLSSTNTSGTSIGAIYVYE